MAKKKEEKRAAAKKESIIDKLKFMQKDRVIHKHSKQDKSKKEEETKN